MPALANIYPPECTPSWATILGAADNYPELSKPPAFMSVGKQLVLTDLLTPLTPTIEAGVKVFNLTIDETSRRVDELMPPDRRRSASTARCPGRRSGSTRATRSASIFTNNLKETTGIHFHGIELDDFFQDGVPFVTQLPIVPGEIVRLRVHGQPGRLADVPLAPQRDRPGRPRPAGRVHRRAARATR